MLTRPCMKVAFRFANIGGVAAPALKFISDTRLERIGYLILKGEKTTNPNRRFKYDTTFNMGQATSEPIRNQQYIFFFTRVDSRHDTPAIKVELSDLLRPYGRKFFFKTQNQRV